MKIDDHIVKAYLEGRKLAGCGEEWYFTRSEIAEAAGKNIFTEPENSAVMKEKVKQVYDEICTSVKNFTPGNVEIWDALFHDWRAALEESALDLIVGLPEPYDATALCDTSGNQHMIFDLVCWTKYLENYDLSQLVQNLLTHELCHVLLYQQAEQLENALASGDYLTKLDAVTFDEGFAHLVSYKGKNISEISWKDDKLAEVWRKNSQRMKEALAEREPVEQNRKLDEAVCGKYNEKFACMCGMLYLADLRQSGGIQALQEVYAAGFRGFAQKAVYQDKNVFH